MANLNIDIKLRPIRFGFLVRPDDKENLLKIFRINTCLWGGQYNPIIPYFDKVPKWWSRHKETNSAEQIINGYLDYFEPDLLVEAEPGLAKKFGYDTNRVIALDHILQSNEGRYLEGYGQSVNDLYKHLYSEEFKFSHKEKPEIFLYESMTNKDALFLSCLCGDFPKEKKLRHFEDNFRYIFSAENKKFSAENLVSYYRTSEISPLQIANVGINVTYKNDHTPFLFVLDISKSSDMLDFWNLRAVCKNVLAIPKQWLPQLEPFCKEFIELNYRPLPGNQNGVMIHPTVIFSRSIDEVEAQKLHKKYIFVDKEGVNTIQYWYPCLWRESPKYTTKKTRPILIAEQKRAECSINDSNGKKTISFNRLSPKFYLSGNTARTKFPWVNILQLDNQFSYEDVATIFPCNYKRSNYLQLKYNLAEPVFYSREGIILFCEGLSSLELLKLPTNTEAFKNWFKLNNISTSLSPSGKITTQIIQALDGFLNLWAIASKGIVDLLNTLSKSDNKTMGVQEFRNKVNKQSTHVANSLYKNRNFEILVSKQVVTLGLEVHCENCDQWGWYQLDKLNNTLLCNFCLKPFNFPICYPDNSQVHVKWSYRVIGPFALNNYAKGAYSAALSLKFFHSFDLFHSRNSMTWTSGMKLNFPSGEEIEVDFLVWYQEKDIVGLAKNTEIVFGEAKSYGKDQAFEKKDIKRMRVLANKFPGCYLVFSTFNDKLSSKEIALIAALAKWGRKFLGDKSGRLRANIIVLTGVELFSQEQHLKSVWDAKGGEHKKLSTLLLNADLEALADLTQQLYLDLPSISGYMHSKFFKKKNKKAATAKK